MSQPRPDLDNSVKALKEYITYIKNYSGLVEIRLWGSRSPLKRKQHRDDSDWDLIVVWERPTRSIDPRTRLGFHADIASVGKEDFSKWTGRAVKTSIQIYPTDKHNILKETN